MRTLLAGIGIAKRTPLSLVPMTVEAVLAAGLVLMGVFASDTASVPGAGVYPMGLFHDLKQALALATWPVFLGTLASGIAVRSLTLSATLWLAEGRPGNLMAPWLRMVRWSVLAVATLFPSALLYTVGVGVRYAPFIWVAGGLGVFTAVLLARGAVAMDAGSGSPQTATVPEFGSFLGYGLFLSAAGALVQTTVDASWAWALLFLLLGPLNALMLLGWRERLRSGRRSGAASFVVAIAMIGPLLLLAVSINDRSLRNPQPEEDLRRDARLAVLQGVDSTSTTGALSMFDPRDVGVARGRRALLSYRAAGEPYEAEDTRADLDLTARRVAAQLGDLEPPVLVLGHSQAALIMDRALRGRSPGGIEAIAVLAAPPSMPAPLELRSGTPGHLAATGLAALLDVAGFTPFDVDAGASPTKLQEVHTGGDPVPRLALWALGDSVWLDSDWRRGGEHNVVVLTDHVGITRNERALDVTSTFFRGSKVEDDERSWRGLVVEVLRYVFEPWRPDR
ncbi:MAG: hypothetical protein GEU78_02960 [Actinobacteria bacterium]|nr:hypothetical protein [Actinomycetota bacterium]